MTIQKNTMLDLVKVNQILNECDLKSHHYKCIPPDKSPPALPGIYIVWRDDGIEYVGQSENMLKRLYNNHSVFDPTIHQISFVLVTDEHTRLKTETSLINKIKPPANGTRKISHHLGIGRSKVTYDLSPELIDTIRNIAKRERFGRQISLMVQALLQYAVLAYQSDQIVIEVNENDLGNWIPEAKHPETSNK